MEPNQQVTLPQRTCIQEHGQTHPRICSHRMGSPQKNSTLQVGGYPARRWGQSKWSDVLCLRYVCEVIFMNFYSVLINYSWIFSSQFYAVIPWLILWRFCERHFNFSSKKIRVYISFPGARHLCDLPGYIIIYIHAFNLDYVQSSGLSYQLMWKPPATR